MRHTAITCCAALVALLVAQAPALAQQKTVKECDAEWTANKAEIQKSGKTKKQFVAECRGVPEAAEKPAVAPAKPAAGATGKKTVKECDAEWTANKAEIQKSGKTKKQFVAECRGVPEAAEPPAAVPPPAAEKPAPAPEPAAAEKPAPAPQPAPAAAKPAKPARPATPSGPAVGKPAGANQFATESEAKAHCPTDTVVWANTKSNIYHYAGTSDYEHGTKVGAFMCEKDTAAAGIRAAKDEKHP